LFCLLGAALLALAVRLQASLCHPYPEGQIEDFLPSLFFFYLCERSAIFFAESAAAMTATLSSRGRTAAKNLLFFQEKRWTFS